VKEDAGELLRKANKFSQKKEFDEQSLIKVKKRLKGTIPYKRANTELVDEESFVAEN
jgi:hypothetical protein